MLSPNKCQYARTIGRLGEAIADKALTRAGLSYERTGFNSPLPDRLIRGRNRREKRILGNKPIGLEVKCRTHDKIFSLRHAYGADKFNTGEYALKLLGIVGIFPSVISEKSRAWLNEHHIIMLPLREAVKQVMLFMASMCGLLREGLYAFNEELMLKLEIIEDRHRIRLRRLYDKFGRYLYDAHTVADTTHPVNPLKIHLWQRVGSDDLWGLL